MASYDDINSTLQNIARQLGLKRTITGATTSLAGTVSVSSLPLPSTSTGNRSMVNDSSVTAFYAVVVGGGSSTVPVFSDGTNWRIG